MNVSLRPAVIEDARLLFSWQVNPLIRCYFRNPNPPTWGEHLAWLKCRLGDPDAAIYLILDGSEPVGVLRFDRKVAGVFELSILIDPQFQGRGLGKAGLALGRKLCPAAEFHAEVLPDNTFSHGLFQAAGYVNNGSGLYVNQPGGGTPICVVYADGGPGVGLGHVRRCFGSAKALQAKGWLVLFLETPRAEISPLAAQAGFDVVPIDNGEAALAVAAEGAAVLLVDHYGLNLETLAAEYSGFLVAFDDCGNRPLPVDLVINGSPAASMIDYSALGARHVLAGTDYQIIRDDLHPVESKAPEMPPQRLLVTIGGGDPLRLTDDLLHMLERTICLQRPELAVDFVVGPYASGPCRPCHPAITRHHAPARMADLIAAADVAISASGQTLMELLHCCVPTVALCLADNQAANVAALEEAGCILSAGWVAEDGWLARLEAALIEVLDSPALRLRLADAAGNQVEGGGARRIADVLAKVDSTKMQRVLT